MHGDQYHIRKFSDGPLGYVWAKVDQFNLENLHE